MEDEDQYAKPSKISEWIHANPAGREILKAVALASRLWHLHIDRYRLWDETFYRVCSWAVGIVLLLIAVQGFKIGLRHYDHRAEIQAQIEAQNFLARGDFRNAKLSADRALMFNPNNVPACRVMAALAEQQDSPTVLDWLGRIAQHQPTLANKISLALAGLHYQEPPFSFSAGVLRSLPPSATNDPSYQEAVAKLEMGLNHIDEAERHFVMATQLAPENQYFALSVALLQLLSTNQNTQIAARKSLVQFSTNASLGALALRGLIADRVRLKDFVTAKAYSSQLVTNAQANLDDRMQELGILHRLDSPEFPAKLRTIEQECMKTVPGISALSRWMQANGLVEENLAWMMTLPNSMLDRPQVQINRAMGYLQNTNWQRLREVASEGDWGDLEYLRFALVSHAAAKLNSPEMADSNWEAAMKEASTHLADMEHLLDLAESWQLQHEREQLLLWMVRDFPSEQWAERLIRTYQNNGNTLGLHQLYGVLQEYYPTNMVVKADLSVTSMLLKINLNDAFAGAAEAFAKDPTNAIVASTYAFSLHMQDRDLQALDVMKTLPPTALENPSVALNYGVLLASIGRKEEAKTWLGFAQAKGKFLPEEKSLLATGWAQIGAEPPHQAVAPR